MHKVWYVELGLRTSIFVRLANRMNARPLGFPIISHCRRQQVSPLCAGIWPSSRRLQTCKQRLLVGS